MKISYLGKSGDKIIRICSVEEIENTLNDNFSDLQLFFPGRGLFRTSNDLGDLIRSTNESDYLNAKPDEGPHISIHYDPNKPTIFINRTTHLKQGCHFVGIKSDNKFAPVILKIFGNTDQTHYIAKQRHVNNGEWSNISYSPTTDTLVMMPLISRCGVGFHKDPEYPANYIERDFKNFRLTIVFRYFNMPAEQMTINMFQTPPFNYNVSGLEWWEVCNLLNDLEQMYTLEYFKKYPERNHHS